MPRLSPVLRRCAGGCLLIASAAAPAATFVVDTVDVDLPDSNTALAGCDANPILAGDQCTLRAAIMQANASVDADTIVLPLNSTITLTLNGAGGAESGDLDITSPLTITGVSTDFPASFATLPRVQGNISERLFDIGQDIAVTFRGLQLADGAPTGIAGSNGGALRITADGASVEVDRVRFSGNSAATGAAIANSGSLLVEGSDFIANIASSSAAAIHTAATGQTTLRRSSIREIRNQGATREALRVAAGGRLVVENSYLDGASQLGAPPQTPTSGIRADFPQQLVLRNATLVGFSNHALDLLVDGSSTVRVYNTLLAGSSIADCTLNAIAGPPADIVFDYNVVQANDCGQVVGGGNLVGQSPLLGAIESAANRFVVTRRPPFGSPAVDAGAPVDLPGNDPLRACLAADLLATPRPLDGNADGEPRCDIGAVEAMALGSSTYVVNTYDADLPDGNPGDDVCDGNPLAQGAQCTLRAAVMEANAKPGPDRIAFGGGPGNRTVTLTRAGAGGADLGDLDISEQLVIEGQGDAAAPQVVTLDAPPGDRVFDVLLPAGQTFALRDLRVRDGEANADGGALRVQAAFTAIERLVFEDNAAAGAGGALSAAGGTLNIRNSDFHRNDAGAAGGAIASSAHATVLEGVSLRRNEVAGGALRSALAVNGGSSLLLRTTTVHANSGGISTEATDSIDIRGSTLAGNADRALYVESGAVLATVRVRATVFADNDAHCELVGAFGGNVMQWNYLDVADGECGPPGGNSQVGDPLLAPLPRRQADTVSLFRVPLSGSPLIDAIPADAGSALCAGFDQRGIARPIDSDADGTPACEIGAVELSAAEAGPRQFTVTVTTDLIDQTPGDGVCTLSGSSTACSLRQAVMEANALPGPDTIVFASGIGTVTLSLPPGAADNASEGDLDLTGPTTIRGVLGNPAARPLIQAMHGDRIFDINDVEAGPTPFVIEGLRLSGGSSSGQGGAIRATASADVTLRQLALSANTADAGGGALGLVVSTVLVEDVDLHGNGTAGDGAAIASDGNVTLRRSSIRGNIDLGGENEREAVLIDGNGTLLIENSTFSGNAGSGVRVLDGSLEVRNSTFTGHARRGIEFAGLAGRSLLIRNSALTGNTLGACSVVGIQTPGIATDGYNLTQGTGCALHAGASNIVSDLAALGPLQTPADAFTAWHVPLPASPLRDAGHPDISVLGCSGEDQRGSQRPLDSDGDGAARCDIGAIEATPLGERIFGDGFE